MLGKISSFVFWEAENGKINKTKSKNCGKFSLKTVLKGSSPKHIVGLERSKSLIFESVASK